MSLRYVCCQFVCQSVSMFFVSHLSLVTVRVGVISTSCNEPTLLPLLSVCLKVSVLSVCWFVSKYLFLSVFLSTGDCMVGVISTSRNESTLLPLLSLGCNTQHDLKSIMFGKCSRGNCAQVVTYHVPLPLNPLKKHTNIKPGI